MARTNRGGVTQQTPCPSASRRGCWRSWLVVAAERHDEIVECATEEEHAPTSALWQFGLGHRVSGEAD